MKAWAKSRHVGGYALGCILVSVAVIALSHVEVYFPNLRAGPLTPVHLVLLISAIPCFLSIAVVPHFRYGIESVAVRARQVSVLDYLVTLVPPVVTSLPLIFNDELVVRGAGRNSVIFTLLTLAVVKLFKGAWVALFPLAYLAAASVFGFGYGDMQPDNWAFVLDKWDSNRDLVAITTLLVVSIACYLWGVVRGELNGSPRLEAQ